MKKPKINLSWPAQMFDFHEESNSNEKFSRGKLRVFYKGETADHRYFSDAFAEELVKSLPYTPVVSYYDEEKGDFKGHASEQAIYGIVDPCVPPSFEKDEQGHEWCICDTVLYTERPGEVGRIAKQIADHSQSLELTDAKYTINYDEKRHFKNIEFTEGKFIGVSVLGNDQKPAFTGSQFFSSNSDFEEKMNLLKKYCETKNDQESQEKVMKITNYVDFMNLTWGEISTKVADSISKEYSAEAYTILEDLEDGFAYVLFYSYIDGSSEHYRISYSIDENGTVALGEAKKVHRTWEVIEDASEAAVETEMSAKSVEEPQDEEVQEKKKEEMATKEEEEEKPTEDKSSEEEKPAAEEKPEEEKKEDEEKPKEEYSLDETQITNAAEVSSEEEELEVATETPSQEQFESEELTVDNNHQELPSEEKEVSSTSTPAKGEEEQFTALKPEEEVDLLKEKVNLLNSYKDQLDTDKYGEFMSNIMSFENSKDLEVSILKSIVSLKEETSTNRRAFSYAYVNNTEKKDDTGDSWVGRALRRTR